jgi:hypothetical protein
MRRQLIAVERKTKETSYQRVGLHLALLCGCYVGNTFVVCFFSYERHRTILTLA